MPRKEKNEDILEEVSDDELQYVAPQMQPTPTLKKSKMTLEKIPQISRDLNNVNPANPQISQPINALSSLQEIPKTEGSVSKKQKQKRNISEEQKQILRERIKIATAKKMELAEQRKQARTIEEENHLAQKQLRILEQARLIKQNHKKQLKAIEETPIQPVMTVINKGKKTQYVVESESESEEEQPVIVIKKKKSAKQVPPEPAPAPTPAPAQPPTPILPKFRFV
jgi:hypothetical protein